MKKAKINLQQKLVLNKEIVSALDTKEQDQVLGGGTLFSKPCGSCGGFSNCCPPQSSPLVHVCFSNDGPTRCDCVRP